MPEWISGELVTLLYHLLPGFVAAWIFYGLTAHPKADAFERVIQALIFTFIIQVLTKLVEGLCLAIGQVWHVGIWTNDTSLIWSLVLAFPVGLLIAKWANQDTWHLRLRGWNWTKRTSHPSEWCSAFSRQSRWVVLHFLDGRRLYGWATEWPDQCDKGHFFMEDVEWLLADGSSAPLHRTAAILLPASNVEMVEFVRDPSEITASDEEIVRMTKLLVQVNSKEKSNGSESTSTAAFAEAS